MPSFTAGDIITEDYFPVVVVKSSNTSRSSTTTISDDPHLTVTLGPGTWRVELLARVTGASGGDFKCAWDTSGVTTSNLRACVGPTSGTTDATATSMHAAHHGFTTEVTYGTDGSNNGIIHETMIVSVTTSGTMTLQWAQGTSSATSTTLGSDSHICATPVHT